MIGYKFQRQPLCRFCGGPIPKATVRVEIKKERTEYDKPSENWQYAYHHGRAPTSKAAAQTLVNQQVVGVSYRKLRDRKGEVIGREIDHVTTWDGESYVDPFFCNGNHAKDFAYMMARSFPDHGHKNWTAAVAEQRAKELEPTP
jgi:hypothetical protein